MREFFPIHPNGSDEAKQLKVPFDLMEAHSPQAFSNHGQSVERLADRAGCDAVEILLILTDRKLFPLVWQIPESEAVPQVQAIVDSWSLSNSPESEKSDG